MSIVNEIINQLQTFELEQVAKLSIEILGIYVAFHGILKGPKAKIATFLDRTFGLKNSKQIQKPLWGCFPCMSSFWSIVLTGTINPFLMIALAGTNYLIELTFLSEAE